MTLNTCFIFFFLEDIDDYPFNDPPNPVVCPNMCGRSYKGNFRKYSLKRHLFNECGVDPRFECPVCQKRFKDKGSMKRHVAGIHREITFV